MNASNEVVKTGTIFKVKYAIFNYTVILCSYNHSFPPDVNNIWSRLDDSITITYILGAVHKTCACFLDAPQSN
jgi:hypothetical protein